MQALAKFLCSWISSDTGKTLFVSPFWPKDVKCKGSVKHFLTMLKSYTKEIWILEGGIENMRAKYPLVVSPKSSSIPATPIHVDDLVFLGRSAFELKASNLHGLRITHVITRNNPCDLVEGINYYSLSFDLEYPESIGHAWEFALETIGSIKNTQGARILVQLNGHATSLTAYDNLSASVIVAYLTRTAGVPIQAALDYISHTCPRFTWKTDYLQLFRSGPLIANPKWSFCNSTRDYIKYIVYIVISLFFDCKRRIQSVLQGLTKSLISWRISGRKYRYHPRNAT